MRGDGLWSWKRKIEMSFINPEPTRLGLVCLARLTFEADLAAQWYQQAQAMIRTLDGVQLVAVSKLVIESDDADAAIAELRAANVDALVVLSGTFALGGLAMRLAQAFADTPLLLWAWLNRSYRGVVNTRGALVRALLGAGLAALLAFLIMQLPVNPLILSLAAMGLGLLVALPFIWQELKLLIHL